ncbi:hypothetical protein [Marinomonas mediterranea]|jgi:hypothetical protein|uniref:Uncharacterized protein n=1 Tax=Marinomonas mediterranea (strain ATCC 700492 / JCM 21426 / NBRC 103028 / MMB-1) TaxID=717774 RepID=F2JZ39_MARM1|nr:hypothetical protein [Marinomonas mediterranea]ADZ92017.1 hypothetical protein Marme_2794 [Marinomonas mediterranea MMB-1]WCN18093.1 hypothetical protein GV053_14100 [Marinomonas mediterranea MMB-1]
MTDLKQLVKEEVVKNIIDKLVFGLMAALIVFGVQKCSDTNQREQIEREAILRLDSGFVLNEAKILQSTFSDYVSVIAESISLVLPPTQVKEQQLLLLRVRIESSVEVLSVHRSSIAAESTAFVAQITALNTKLRSFDSGKIEEYQEDLNALKIKYGALLKIIKTSAIDLLPE